MNTTQQIPSTPDDRIMAALAHGAVLLGFWGIVISGVIWGTQREKAAYVRFQALQALVYQITGLVLQLLFGLLWGLCGFGLFFLMTFGTVLSVALVEEPSRMPLPVFLNMFSPFGMFCLMIPYLLICLGFIAYGFYGAYQTYQGRDFRYAVIGARVERYLAQPQPTEG